MEQNNLPKPGLSNILSDAFRYWNRTLFFQLLYSLLFFSLFFLGYFYLFQRFGLWEEYSKYLEVTQNNIPALNEKMKELAELPQMGSFILAVFVLLALLNPLNVGFYKIYRKIDLGEKPELNDLFAGYLGFNFFKYFGFYLFWFIVFSYGNSLLILGLVWIFITLFSLPLMFFMDLKIFDGIRFSIKGLRKDFPTIVVAMFVALLFGLSGILVFGFGFLFTFPFWNAMIYSLYKHYFKELS